MFRKYVLVLFVCILSLCIYQNLSYADDSTLTIVNLTQSHSISYEKHLETPTP